MDALRILGAFMIVPATILLTISFFVLVVMRKLDKGFVRALGLVAVLLLWICSLIVFSTGIFIVSLKDYCYFKELKRLYGYPHAQMFDRYHNRDLMQRGFMNNPHHRFMGGYHGYMDPGCGFSEQDLGPIPESLKQ